jgi:hypothetical protein
VVMGSVIVEMLILAALYTVWVSHVKVQLATRLVVQLASWGCA